MYNRRQRHTWRRAMQPTMAVAVSMTAAPSMALERQTQPAPAHSTGSDTRGSWQCNTGGGSVDDGSTLDGSREADIPGTSSSTDRQQHTWWQAMQAVPLRRPVKKDTHGGRHCNTGGGQC
jgi:hypothetical protein